MFLSSKVKKDNCWLEQSPKKLIVPLFLGVKFYLRRENVVLVTDIGWHNVP